MMHMNELLMYATGPKSSGWEDKKVKGKFWGTTGTKT